MANARQHWAAECSRAALEPLGRRWLHVQGVGRLAEALRPAFVPEEGEVLVSAAYLHDIGYAPGLRVTGLHQLDGALHVRALGYGRLSGLVAHHSEARFEVALSGFGKILGRFPRECSPVSDALIYCDLITSPSGLPVDPADRLEEVGTRYEPGNVVMRALAQAKPHLLAAIHRTRIRLRQHGIGEGC